MTDWLGMGARPVVPRPELKAAVLARALAAGRSRRRPLAAAATIALALVAGAAAFAALRTERALRRAETERAELAHRVTALEDTLSLLRGSGTHVVHIPLRVGAVTIFADSATRRWLVACHDMAPNAPGETYQLWFVTAAGMRSAGLMAMDHDQPMMMALDMPAGGVPVTGAAMTIEPRAGSVVPGERVVFQVRL